MRDRSYICTPPERGEVLRQVSCSKPNVFDHLHRRVAFSEEGHKKKDLAEWKKLLPLQPQTKG